MPNLQKLFDEHRRVNLIFDRTFDANILKVDDVRNGGITNLVGQQIEQPV